MQIRKWQVSDCNQIAVLEEKCFSDPWSLDMILSAVKLDNFFGFVICEDEEIKGYIGATALFEDGEILLVAVDEELRGNGYGKALVLKANEIMLEKGCERCFLEVRKSNLPAKACYLSCGFKPIGERRRYYKDGEDAIIMEKVL